MSKYYPPPQGPPPHHGASDDYYGNSGYAPPQQPDATSYGNQQQQQPYQQPNYDQPPPSTGPPKPAPNNGVPDDPPPPYSFEDQFPVQKPKHVYNDLWAAVLFLLTLFGFIAVSGLSLHGYSSTRGTQGGGIYDDKSNDFGLSTNTIVLFIFVLVVAFVMSFLYFIGARKFTKQFIWATGILNIVVGIGTAIYYLCVRYYSAGIVFLIFGLFYAYCFWSWRSRIPFAVLLLETTMDVARHCGHIFLASAIGGLFAIAFAAWFATTFVGVYAKYTPSSRNPACGVGGGGCSKAKLIGLLVFITFAGYWISEVIKNVLHTTVSGVYGSWYFCSRQGMPRHPTIGAFKRSMTSSFGSICFGSLIVSLIQLLRQACSLAQQQNAADGNIVTCAIWCCLTFILQIANWLVEFFNQYAYSYIALYGKAYIPAAKDTWRMMKDRGFDALINNCLVDPVLTSGAVFVGYLCAFLAYLYLEFTHPRYNVDRTFTPVVMAFSFLIGLQVCNIFMVPLKSGVATIFVSMAHDPEVMRRDHPQLYQAMVSAYPHVMNSVHG